MHCFISLSQLFQILVPLYATVCWPIAVLYSGICKKLRLRVWQVWMPECLVNLYTRYLGARPLKHCKLTQRPYLSNRPQVPWVIWTIAAIWRENMHGYLSLDIICSEKRTVYEEQIMSKEKYPSIFSPSCDPLSHRCVISVLVSANSNDLMWSIYEIVHIFELRL